MARKKVILDMFVPSSNYNSPHYTQDEEGQKDTGAHDYTHLSIL